LTGAVTLRELGAPVRARVHERPELSIAGAGDDDRDRHALRGEVAARALDLTSEPDILQRQIATWYQEAAKYGQSRKRRPR
jgi:hypothetical protein